MNDSSADSPVPVDILLVEDNPGDVRLIRDAITHNWSAATVHVVKDGIRALDFLFQCGDFTDAPRPDIVLLDLNLPRKNGDEVLKALKSDSSHMQIPVIVLTGSQSKKDVKNAYKLHANACFTKPVNPIAFQDAIGTIVEFWFAVAQLPVYDE